jgi:tetratricopeptide (TPR) repeat protein
MLLGGFAALLLAAAAGTAWFEAASEGLPRLAEGPQYEHCLGLLRQDPEGARAFAESWEPVGGEGARHCAALALLALGETERAAERLEQLARGSGGSGAARAAVFAQAVQAWMLAGQTGRAFASATMGLTLAPADADLLLDRAVALGTMGRYAEALEDLDRVATLDADRAEAWVYRAAALRHLNQMDQAATAAARALALTPDNAEALLERGIIRQMRGDGVGARADWERVIALAPDGPTADLALRNLALNEAGPRRR